MAATRRAYTGGAQSTTTSSAIASSGTTSFTITAYTGWPYGTDPFFVVVEPGTASEEKILVTRTGSTDTTINIASDSERGQDGTSAVGHSSGSVVFPVFTALDADEANAVASIITADTTNSRIGIGTATPVQALDVAGNINLTGEIDGPSDFTVSNGQGEGIEFSQTDNATYLKTLNISRLTIDSSGKVGINDTSPSYKLDVDGDINATGDLRIGGTAIGTWEDFPSGTGFQGITEGDGDLVQRYCVINEMVFFYAYFTLGSTSALSNAGFQVPVTMANVYNGQAFSANMNNGAIGYAAGVRRNTADFVLIRALDVTGTYASQSIISSSVPFTWGSGDGIAIEGFYEKA